ncbi:TonB-dependent receptor plug domain-containing protein [Pontibacter anaerobius]|uniref:TonB-dependent receptor n=1 Tax=Pontibacter anaerobius TaxID=2993940 RepID=A0ABT3RAJ7_9BACT|nr:TonB-dependent receptor [Pontibacter anaerobius]MCX2738456.1 TonB-dependent receptor [Pontibacter anaerobius]
MARFSFLNVWLCACLSTVATTAVSQQDTTQHQLLTVEVFGKPAEVYAAGSRVVQVDSAFLSTYSSGSLAEALQARTPIYFKSYGASGSSTVAFRGTNASQTAVLWNGLHIVPATLGQADFSTLPLSGLGEVAVQHGAAAANYGSGAIGGAVLLNSPKYRTHGFVGDIKLETGSFGRYFGSGSAGYSSKSFSYGLSAYGQLAENNFKYKDLSRFGTPEVRQQHAQVQQQGFTQDLSWQLSPRTGLALHGWYTSSDRELPPAMGSSDAEAQQKDENLRLMVELQHESQLGQTSIKAAYFNDYLHYTDRSTDSESGVETYQLQAEQTYTYGERWSLRGGLNLQHFEAKNDGYSGQKDENRASLFALFRFDPLQPLQLSLNLRQALAEGYNPPLTPALGFNWKFFNSNQHQVSLKGNVSGSYRLPTLNDRFWAGAGNPNLKPEEGWNYELGLRHVLVQGNAFLLETEVTGYYMLIDDWIQWTPSSTGLWRPMNLQKVESKGIELSSTASATVGEVTLNSTVGYTYTSSEQVEVYEGSGDLGRQLMYVPHHKAILSAEAKYKNWSLLGNLNYTGLRYTSNSETSHLKDFILLNLALSRKLQLGQNTLLLTLRSDNVANTEYQTMAYRPMPPRSYTFSLRFIIP